jgi:hypothetical protein
MGERIVCDGCNQNNIFLMRSVFATEYGQTGHAWMCEKCFSKAKSYTNLPLCGPDCAICCPQIHTIKENDDGPRQYVNEREKKEIEEKDKKNSIEKAKSTILFYKDYLKRNGIEF